MLLRSRDSTKCFTCSYPESFLFLHLDFHAFLSGVSYYLPCEASTTIGTGAFSREMEIRWLRGRAEHNSIVQITLSNDG